MAGPKNCCLSCVVVNMLLTLPAVAPPLEGNAQYGQQQEAYQQGPPQQQGYPPQQQYPGQQGYPPQQQGYGELPSL